MGEELTNPIELSSDRTSSVNMAADDEGISSISTQGKISKWIETTEPEVINKGKPQIITKDKFEIIDLCSLDEDDNEKQEKGVKKANNTFIRRSANSEAHKKKDTMGRRRLRIPKHGAGTYPVCIGNMHQRPDEIEVFAVVAGGLDGLVARVFHDPEFPPSTELLVEGPPINSRMGDIDKFDSLGKLFVWGHDFHHKTPKQRHRMVCRKIEEIHGLQEIATVLQAHKA
ncbi:hypothetical protein CBER1_10330 [Cercospora berteroae]|uniref:Uncharacterized protein n=1 Tax=Cercospora berteroae TaxID=357750 RepID=A0A2S6CHR7_9PEZI|nr:hypothetical protein CBER1_10330 [Cercospora berteroae]